MIGKRVSALEKKLPALYQAVDYNLMRSSNGHERQLVCPYYKGVKAAKEGHLDEAQTYLEEASRLPQLSESANKALSEVYRCRAHQVIDEKDMLEVANLLGKAQSLDPNNQDVVKLLDYLGQTLPTLELLGGKRQQACDKWIGAVSKNMMDFQSIRCLALAYYWWALEHSDAGRWAEAGKAWEESAMYWSLLLACDDFILEFALEKEKCYGKAIETDNIRAACQAASAKILREILVKADSLRQQEENQNPPPVITGKNEPKKRSKPRKDSDARKTILRAYGAALGELRAAELLAEVVRSMGKKVPRNVRIGGPSALSCFGGIEPVRDLLGKAKTSGLDLHLVSRAQLAFSDHAPEWGLIEAKLFDLAIEQLESNTKRSSQQTELLAQAYIELGVSLKDEQGSVESFNFWIKAVNLNIPHDSALLPDIEKHAISAARPISENASNHEIAKVRKLVEQMRSLSNRLSGENFRGILSTTIAGLALLEFHVDNEARALDLLREALGFNSGNQLARQGLSMLLTSRAIGRINDAPTYNMALVRVAIRESRDDLNEAVRLDPNNQRAQQNLTQVRDMMRTLNM